MADTTRTFTAVFTADAGRFSRGVRQLTRGLDGIRDKAKAAEKAVDSLGDSDVQIDADADGLTRALKFVERRVETLRADLDNLPVDADPRRALRALDRAERELKRFQRLAREDVEVDVTVDTSRLSRARGALSGIGGGLAAGGAAAAAALSAVAAGAAVAAGGVGLVGLAALKASDEAEVLGLQFEYLLGSKEKADRLAAQVRDLAAKTPFETADIAGAAKTLLAFGIPAEKAVGYVTALGDASAATGAGLGDLSEILGQINAKPTLQNEELLQLQERGVRVYDILADKMGKTTGEIQKMASEGKILGKDALPLIIDGLENGTKNAPKFGGAMERISQTLSGQWSTLKDNVTAALTPLGQALTPVVLDIVDMATPVLARIGDWIARNQENIKNATGILAGYALQVGGWALKIAGFFLTAQAKVARFLADFVGGVATVSGVLGKIPGFDAFADLADDLRGAQTALDAQATGYEKAAVKAKEWGDAAVDAGSRTVTKYKTLAAEYNKTFKAVVGGQTIDVRVDSKGVVRDLQGVKVELDKVPENKTVEVEVAKGPFRADIAEVNALIGTIPKAPQTKVVALVSEAQKRIDAVKEKANGLPPEKRLKVIADTAAAEGRLREFRTNWYSLRDRTLTLTQRIIYSGERKEKGGPVAAGRTYLVGEAGPEIFQPTSSGRIIPNHRLTSRDLRGIRGQTGGVVVQTKVEIAGREVAAVVRSAVRDELAAAGTSLRRGVRA